ncbi:protein-(glutamine-N5) methyltransferase, release factor-specific [Chloroflexus islandicus]|uniref:Release factor glutamine methyltransferase n=1 Tax=Chloroflexus islandicus TaxID=1707952 RepID=A0A178M551_9CHLR|nr:peptide chain release factor N(5)-glutamine methyltransferase [Chloroflexus islandicus]OAN43693.1 protein-(glutamine-N5) methyltransferase, release factor-specific [Chloroflexus islandicus]
MSDDVTIQHALRTASEQLRAVSATARLDAELLLAHTLGWSRAKVVAERDYPLTPAQQATFAGLVARRAAREPVAYLIGHREFFGLDLLVDQRVLIPRPETEVLVELALAEARRYGNAPITIADIGAGSGAIAIALAMHLPHAIIYGVDLSAGALEVAAANVARYRLHDRITLLEGDLLEPLPGPVDLIVSNPPYTILNEIEEGVYRYEPHLALDGGPDGLDCYRRLIAAAPAYLKPDGAILLEIGAWQAAAVVHLLRQAMPQAEVGIQRDLAGRDRVVWARNPDVIR